MAILIAIGLLVKEMGSINLNVINSSSHFFNNKPVVIACFLLLIGVVGKSAQVGLHMWLPDAMEGPTPVSALIHAATMVTAGVFLIIKLSPLFATVKTLQFFILLIGSLTCIMAAIVGSTQADLKKIIAYSTCSQLGYMVMVGGYGYYTVSLFHLFNHGIFKALLFLSAGLVIHTLMNEQNLLKMGLKNISPLGKYGFIIGNLAIAGFPFLTGFYSKDLFLELLAGHHVYFYPLWLGYLAASLTCFYSLKLLYISYNKENRYSPIFNPSFHPNVYFILLPLFLLALGSVVLGFVLFKTLNEPVKPIVISNLIKGTPLLILLSIVFLFVFGLISKSGSLFKSQGVYTSLKLFVNSFYFNELVSKGNLFTSKASFQYTYKLIDSQVLEWWSTSTITKSFTRLASTTSIQSPIHLTKLIGSLLFFTCLLSLLYI